MPRPFIPAHVLVVLVFVSLADAQDRSLADLAAISRRNLERSSVAELTGYDPDRDQIGRAHV